MGATTYIAKPFASAGLVNAVQHGVGPLALNRQSATPQVAPEEQP
jgi:hypothetical protein